LTMRGDFEIMVKIPDGSRLVGTKTVNDTVIIVCRTTPEPRLIGFVQTEPFTNENDNAVQE